MKTPHASNRRPRVALAASFAAGLVLLGACSETKSQPTQPIEPSTVTPVLTRQVVLADLSQPWDIAFAPDGSMFFTEKCRGLSVRRPNGTITRLFGTAGSSPGTKRLTARAARSPRSGADPSSSRARCSREGA